MTDLTIPSTDTSIKAYLAVPTGAGPWPGVVVIQDAFGLTNVTRAHADRLASYGFLALAPDLYSRGGMVRCVRTTFRSMLSGTGQAYDDIEAARESLIKQADCSGRIGVIGFCMGGGFALMTARRGFDAAAPNYGQLPKDMGLALEGACPVVASFGAKDRTLRGAAGRLEAALQARGITHDVKEYPDAGHSFLDQFPRGPWTPLMRVAGFGYHQPSAEDAWRRIRDFLQTQLMQG
jgi:carboxymethylenebutenolidase